MKVSKRDVLLLLGFLGILAAVCSYVFVFQPTMEKTEAMKEENQKLEERIADLQNKSDNKESYESQTAQMNLRIEEIFQLFPVDVREENAVLLAINQELLSPMEVESVTIDALLEVPVVEVQSEEMPDATYEIEEVEAIEDDLGTQEAPTPEAGDAQGDSGMNPFSLMYRRATLNYEVSYEGLKRSIKNICMQTDRMVIDNLAVVYDEQTGLLKGSTTINMFCVPNQEGKEYEQPDFGGVLLGTDNIFGTRIVRSEGNLPDLEEGAEGEAGEETAEE